MSLFPHPDSRVAELYAEVFPKGDYYVYIKFGSVTRCIDQGQTLTEDESEKFVYERYGVVPRKAYRKPYAKKVMP